MRIIDLRRVRMSKAEKRARRRQYERCEWFESPDRTKPVQPDPKEPNQYTEEQS